MEGRRILFESVQEFLEVWVAFMHLLVSAAALVIVEVRGKVEGDCNVDVGILIALLKPIFDYIIEVNLVLLSQSSPLTIKIID